MKTRIICLVCLLLMSSAAIAEEAEYEEAYGFLGGRSELWLGFSFWPALADLEPAANGEFDASGLALGGAIHWPVSQMERSDLLLGLDMFFAATGSDLRGVIGDLNARHMYLGASAKWAFGEKRNFYADAGFGYHLVDIAQISDSLYGPEQEAWEASKGGAFVGMTWDAGAGRENKTAGLTVSLKAHFVDLGLVRDENPFVQPMLGTNAGQLDGPVYMLQIGYGGR